MTRAPRRVLAATLGLLAALAVVEVGVRVIAPQGVGAFDGGLLRGPLTTPGDHPVRGAEYAVTVHVNAAGFVDREWPAPGAGREVVVIGDSFVQAAQVAPGEGFGARLEAGLRAQNVDVDVLSMGVPGAGTATALGVLREYALPRKPALVVLGFLVSNDVLNNHPLLEGKDDKPFYTLRNGVLQPVVAMDLVVPSPLWRWSAAWRWFARQEAARAVADRKLTLGQGAPLDLRVHDPACVNGGGTAPNCGTWDEAWAVTDALLAEMARACGDIPFVVVLFPDRTQVERRTEWSAARAWDFDAAQRRAATVAGQHAPVLDLSPGLRADGGALYLPRDGHWTPRGHAAAAALTVPFVAERL
ncbi:MAG: GDSL-type esterase/lipase family protein [Myxococcota bacterium]